METQRTNGRLKRQVLTFTKMITNNVGNNRGHDFSKEIWDVIQKNVKAAIIN